MFDMNARSDRPKPEMPATTGIEYPRAASWASGGKLSAVLSDDKGRQLFRCFLHESLADENLNFLEAVEKMKRMKNSTEKKSFAQEIISTYAHSINLSASSMNKIKASADSDNPDVNDWAPALKEIRRLLENDQFPRFRRSETFLTYLEQLLPRAFAEKWATSFEALLGNHVGRHHFRLFLRSIRAEENLRFWDAVVEFRTLKSRSSAAVNQARDIVNSFLTEGNPNEVFLPFGVKQVIDSRISEGEVDIGLFDEATKHIEQVLRNDPYIRFLQSDIYLNLLSKLQ